MKTKSKLLKGLISSSFILGSICLINLSAIGQENLSKGAVATADMIKVYYPNFRVGSKWIYNSQTTMNKMNIANFDLTTQILKETSDTFTVKSTGAGINIQETVKKKDFSPISSSNPKLKNIVYKYQGKENIATPTGSYSGADKFSANNMATVWFVKGKGVVKSEAKSSASGMAINSVVSLKSFTY